MRRTEVSCQFVVAIPGDPVEGVIYIATSAATAVHRCCCGCGNTVTTPLGRAAYRIEFDGATISLSRPIDNWKFDCGSQYQIRRNRVRWLARWSALEVEVG